MTKHEWFLRCLLCCSAALTLGCATTTGTQLVEGGKTALDEAKVCCETLNDAFAISLPVEKSVQIVDAKSQAMLFEGQKSFFVLLALPKYDKPYSIIVSSFSLGNAVNAALFLPRISLHAAGKKLTREFDDKSLRSRGNSLERTLFINPENSDEQYLLIRASDLNAKMERDISIVNTSSVYVAPGAQANYRTGADAKLLIQSSPVGHVQIEVRGLSEAGAAKK